MRIFNRVRKKGHPLIGILEQMSKGTDDHRAIACNFMHEPRISRVREQAFLDRLGAYVDPASFTKCLGEYVRQHVQLTSNPDFRTSRNNRMVVPAGDLASMLVINGLSRMFVWAKEFSKTEISKFHPEQRSAFWHFRTYPNHSDPGVRATLAFISSAMRRRSQRKEFLTAIFTLYEIYRVKHPYHPIWLARWSDFHSCWKMKTWDRANRWCHWVGVDTQRKGGQWVAVLRFRARDLQRHKHHLFHPTVLDAGSNPYHFPAPEDASGGGRAADLRNGSVRLAREYVAVWPSLSLAKIDAVRGCAQLRNVTQKPVRKVRRHHVRRLQDEFQRSRVASGWLKRVGVG